MSYHNHPTVLGPVVGGSRGPTSAGRGGQRDEGGAGGLAEARGEKGGGYAELEEVERRVASISSGGRNLYPVTMLDELMRDAGVTRDGDHGFGGVGGLEDNVAKERESALVILPTMDIRLKQTFGGKIPIETLCRIKGTNPRR